MKIDRAKLIELLVENTGMAADEIDSQLKQLIDRILDAAERGKALEIKEFGMFYFDESGDLKFDPSDELSTEINFKYAGMEPVELKPPRSGSDDEDEQSDEPAGTATGEDLDEIFGLDDRDDEPIEDDAEGPDGGALISPPDKVDRDVDPFSGLLGDASSKLKGADKPEGESAEEPEEAGKEEEDPFSFILEDEPEEPQSELDTEESDDLDDTEVEDDEPLFDLDDEVEVESDEPPFALDDEDESDEDSEEFFDPFSETDKEEPVPMAEDSAEEEEPVTKSSTYKKPKKKERDPIMLVISIGLIVIVIVAALFIIPDLFDSSDDVSQQPQPQAQEEAAPPISESPAVEEENQAVLTPVEPEEGSEVTDDEPQAEETLDQPVYGLMGDLVDSANNGYSIVLHSLQSEDRAREQAASLAADGYRVLVSPRSVSGETVWRVSVGQFETLQNAQAAAAELPSPYSSNNFIQRIQTN
ncbi:SPOR domain-containing protein [Rhodohalobacter halophilus]|uniref:SPOR domain-containing protein n=1 Tax=Rhodohalobacter halophilus TaxID=1812810 RepID=UPI00083FBEFE|nr:SPOR domain-containing protein [Rhodohalobacter halophilus]